MNLALWFAAGITLVGALMRVLAPIYRNQTVVKSAEPECIELGDHDAEAHPIGRPQPAARILQSFATIVGILGLVTLIRNWDLLVKNQDSLVFLVWLFLFMVAGMFVQVIASNYRMGQGLLSVSASQLLFPLLFSIVVFYPIWAIATSASHSFFSIHAAFLNGYFWESVVSAAKSPQVSGG